MDIFNDEDRVELRETLTAKIARLKTRWATMTIENGNHTLICDEIRFYESMLKRLG